ncbi:histone deacetylase complex subunit SAP130-A isoform X4 [Rhipicephalus sanguineus]|uniref:histone deacetylase complex subunit SAP130-A isoform X4 n=1 Tax=Rhipicephalus sanguineus TaxID=34632 RepID=UPI001895B673|nr:histone deacetylase complex subunit SAP130-A isoform X4 [Rhipicephalus sanguineus]
MRTSTVNSTAYVASWGQEFKIPTAGISVRMQKMSGVQKAPGSVELKLPDKGEQPMDLAPRTAHQHAAVAASAAKPTQLQVTTIGPALRPHLDTAKSAFTTLGQRLPASPRPVLQPAISVSSTGGNVIAASVTPSYTVKSVGGSSVPQLSTLRHMVTPSATGLSSPNAGTIVTSIASPMASIIRGNTITTTQIGHTLSHQFSSHVPRGPAAVASINTAPKSALATPMLRSSMSQASTAPHIPVGQARAAGLVPARAAFPSMPRSAGLSMAQVMDLQKTYGVPRSGSHGGAGQVQIGFASGRSLEPLARTTLGHPSVSVAKSLHVTQPIVHSLHQVPEKTFKCNTSPATVQYTAVPGLAAGTTGHSAVIPSSPSPLTTSNSSTASCGATIVSPHAQVVQPSVPIRSNMGTMSLVTLAPTSAVQSAPQVVATSQPASLHGSNLATGGSGIHPIFTVVSNKSPLSVAPASTAPSIGIPQNRLAGASRLATTASPAVQPTSVQVAGSATRPITTTVAIHPPTMSVPTVSVVKTRSEDASKDDRRYVPGTKVFGPTSLVGSTAGMHSSSGLEATATVSEPTGNLFVTGATARNLATTISSASSNAPTTASALPATVVISDTRTDRPAQLQGAAATPSYAVPATYLYEPYPIQGATITMHPYAAATPAGVTPVFPVASARPSRPHLVSGGSMPSSATTVVHPPQPLQQQQQQQAQLSQPQQQQPTATHLGALSLGASPTLGVATTLGSPSPLGAASPVGATSLSSTVVPTMGATAGQVVSAASVGTCQATPSAIAAPPPLGSMQQPLGAASLGAAVPLGSTMGSGPLGATTVRAPLMVAVDSTSGRQHQQQQQLVSHSALHTQQTGFTSTGLTAHSNSVSDGVATSQPSAATQPYSCVTPSNLLSPTHSSTPPNHNTSPRPSILRKRTFESAHLSVKKNLMASLPGSEPASPRSEAPASLSTTSSPKPASDIQQESSNSSSTASDPLLPEASKTSSLPMVNIKQEPPDTCETPPNGNASVLPALQNSTVEASPRKKPRKQLLCATELLDIHSTDGDDDMEKESLENLKKEFSRGDDMKCVAFCKRPSMSLLTSYSHNWKTRQNHFIRHSDVKPKDDKKQTVNDLANQKGVLQKANGWKVFHLTSQMEDVVDLEDTVHSKLSQLLNFIEDKPPAIRVKPLNMDEERILNKINDLIKGNLQRSKIVQDQVTEAKQQVLKVLDHKPRIVEIIGKYVSKRPLKKREKM